MTVYTGSDVLKCQCWGQYEGCGHHGLCARPAGRGWSRYFCERCDGNRLRYLTKSEPDPGPVKREGK